MKYDFNKTNQIIEKSKEIEKLQDKLITESNNQNRAYLKGCIEELMEEIKSIF